MENNKILATVGTTEITSKDLETLYLTLDQRTKSQFSSDEGKKNLLFELINQELFKQDALGNKMDEEEDFVNEVERLKDGLLKQYAIGKLLNSITTTDEEAISYYNTNASEFTGPSSVKASHILVPTQEVALKIASEIKEGMTFEEAAKNYSSCPSKSQGGDLGFFSRGKMVPEFEKAAFSMEKDEVSEPIKTQFGYHLIKLTDKKASETKSFEDIKEKIKKQLVSAKQQDAYFAKISELREKYEVLIK